MWQPVDYCQYPILYVDDEKNNLTVFRLAFSDEFTVRVAQSPEEGLRILGKEKIAVLLADQRMPGMTGTALAEVVKERHPEVVRMLVTAYVDSHAAVEAINRGEVYRFISKPWREEEMRTVLRAAIDVAAIGRKVVDLQLKMLRNERLASLGFATAGVSHDMKTPLSTLSLGLDLMGRLVGRLESRREGGATIDETPAFGEIQRVLADCKEANRQLRDLVEAIRCHVREHPTKMERIRPTALADSTLRLCRSEIHARAQLVLEKDECPEIDGDPVQLGQILLNLLINAAQAIPDGETESNRIRLSIGSADGWASLEVEDTGCGVAPEHLGRLFEPFYSTRSGEGGTGLGLAIVREVVDRHGGRIEVTSEPGKGTRVTVLLPPAAPLDG